MLRRLLTALFSGGVRESAAPSPQALERIRQLRDEPLPPELAVAAPRPDVWGRAGYLAQEHYQQKYKPLLTHGFATWALVFHYEGSGDADGRDVVASYGWIDAAGELQTRHIQEGFDPIHAVYGSGQGSIVLDVDAMLDADVERVVLHDLKTGEHILYRALRTGPLSDEEPPPAPATQQPRPTRPDPVEPPGALHLEWKATGKNRSVSLVRPQGRKREVLLTVRRAGSSNREWTLTRAGEVQPSLRAAHQPAPGFAASFQFVDADGRVVGTVTEKAGRIRLALQHSRPRNFYTGAQERKDRRVLLEEMKDVLTLEKTKRQDRDAVVLHVATERSVLELLILALAVVRHPPRRPKEPWAAAKPAA